jgi:copper(I)-binding protein
MMMERVEGGEIAVPAGESVELKPGGLHAMCLQKTGEFAVGQLVDVTLNFANAGEIQVSAQVIDPAGRVPTEGDG